MMKAIVCRTNGGPEVMEWVDVPLPTLAPSEILIRVSAAGLNRADLLQREGKYPPPIGSSSILGMEVAGTVVKTGTQVSRWKEGDQICALLSGGGYAEYTAVDERLCFRVPSDLTLEEAAAIPEALVTVHANVFATGGLKPGEKLLVHGGSSGIGTFAIQMAKLQQAHIFVTAGTDEKTQACLKLGADVAINYHKEDFVTAIRHATASQGVDVILDMIGGDYVPRNLSVLASFGRHISIATQHGRSTTLDLRDIMLKRLLLTGSTLRARSLDEKAHLVFECGQKWERFLHQKRLKPLIYKQYHIKEVAEAHKMMESGAHIGKITLKIA